MKKLLMLAAAAAAILPMTAQAADTATGTVTLNADAAPTCAIRQITRGAAGFGQGTYTDSVESTTGATTAAATLDFNSMLMNQTDATIQTVIEQDLYVDAFCNYAAHNVSLSSLNGGMINTSGTPVTTGSTFNKRIPYNARIRDWAGGPRAELDATGTVTSSVGNTVTTLPSLVTGAFNSSRRDGTRASIRIKTAADASNPLLQGDYQDVLTIRLGAAFGS